MQAYVGGGMTDQGQAGGQYEEDSEGTEGLFHPTIGPYRRRASLCLFRLRIGAIEIRIILWFLALCIPVFPGTT